MQNILRENVPSPPLLVYGKFNCEPGYQSDAVTTELLRTWEAVCHHLSNLSLAQKEQGHFNRPYHGRFHRHFDE